MCCRYRDGTPKRETFTDHPNGLPVALRRCRRQCRFRAAKALVTGMVSWSNYPVAFDTPLNTRQLEVLRWIHEGCPEGRWNNFSYKNVAIALQSRRLVLVSKRGGRWKAMIEPAGLYYLEHGAFPAGHFSKRRPNPQRVDIAQPYSAPRDAGHGAKAAVASQVESAGDEEPSSTPSIRPARALLDEVIAAGGEIRHESKDGPRQYSSLVSAINRHKMAPDGKHLVLESGGSWNKCVIRLEDGPRWLTTPVREVVDAPGIDRWHPALRPLRQGKMLGTSVTAEHRILRIVQAVAVEAAARGYPVAAEPRRYAYHHQQSEPAQLEIKVRDHRYLVAAYQKFRTPPPPPRYGEGQKRPRSQPVEPLGIAIRVPGTDRSAYLLESWSDSNALRKRVEDAVPLLFHRMEGHADREDARREAERLAAIERQRIRQEAERLAAIQHAENVRAERLRNQHAAWREAGQLREFLVVMAATVEAMGRGEQRDAATEWLGWCRRYVDQSVDPLAGPLDMPTIRPPTWEERIALENAFVRKLEMANDP